MRQDFAIGVFCWLIPFTIYFFVLLLWLKKTAYVVEQSARFLPLFLIGNTYISYWFISTDAYFVLNIISMISFLAYFLGVSLLDLYQDWEKLEQSKENRIKQAKIIKAQLEAIRN